MQWRGLKRLAIVTVKLQVSDYNQLADYTVQLRGSYSGVSPARDD